MTTSSQASLPWWQAIVYAIGAGAGLNALLYWAGRQFGILHDGLLAGNPPQPIALPPVLIASVGPVLVAAGVYALLRRFTNQPYRIFSVLAVILLLLSFINPFVGIAGIDLAAGVWLNLMHVVVAGAVLYFFRRWR